MSVMETEEGEFLIAAHYWGLEFMSVPTAAICHQNLV